MRICYDHQIFSSQDFGGVGTEFDLREPFLLVSQHPVTTEYGNNRWQIEQTLYAKSAIGYREGKLNLRRYRKTRLAGIHAQLLCFLKPALVRLYIRAMEGLDAIDAPALCLDYIHNDFHLELWSLNRALGKPYIAYVANLDQVTNYVPHLDLADHILVWGAFHEDVLAGRYGIVTRKLIRVGFCRSYSLAGISATARNPGAGALHVVYFCASNLSNDPGFARNLILLLKALEENAAPYVLALKKHPGSGTELWDRHLETVCAVPLRHGRVELVGNTGDKYSKLEKQRLADKDFSYRDLKDLLGKATHAFSSTSITTLKTAIAGARSYFMNIDGAVDGCFRFEYLRVLAESGTIPMVTRKAQLLEIFRDKDLGGLGENRVLTRVGEASRALAATVASLVVPGAGGAHAAPLPIRKAAFPIGRVP